MKVFMRSPRGWMKTLALKMRFSTTNKQSKMFERKRGFKSRLLDFLLVTYNRTPLPPLEWFVSYDLLFKIDKNNEVFIDMGSKFINTNKSFFTYVETGLGVFSFNTRKVNYLNFSLLTWFMKRRNFSGFIFYSKMAEKSLRAIFASYSATELFDKFNLGVIYPYTPEVKSNSNTENLDSKVLEKKVKRILFCSSSFNLKGGRELVGAFNRLKNNYSIELYAVTDLNEAEKVTLDSKGIHFMQFGSNSNEYYKLIEKSDIIVHPTYFDTHALALLEANKAGLPFVATDTFALSELVSEGSGIFVTSPYAPYCLETGKANFQGRALDYANKIMSNNGCVKLEEELYLGIKKLLDNYISYKDCAQKNIKNELLSHSILQRWDEIIRYKKVG